MAYSFHLDKSFVCDDIVDKAPMCSSFQQWIFSTSLSRRFQAAFPQWREHLGVNIEPTVCFHVDAQVNLCPAISVQCLSARTE